MVLDVLEKAVSSGSVSTQKELRKGYGPGTGDEMPAAVAFPSNVDDVEGIVKWANENGAKLIPVSSAEPHSSAVAVGDDYVAVDMSGMNKIVRADRRNRVALIEPGVTFEQLDAALSRVGLRAMTPLSPRIGKSVLAAYLDRTPTLVPRAQWDLSDPLLCTELVMGTGEVFRTGCAAGPGTLEEQWSTGQAQKNPMGPSSFDFFRLVQGSRGAMGIVTWASAKCELAPSRHELIVVPATGPGPLADVVSKISRAKWGEECLILDARAVELLTGNAGAPEFALLVGVAGFDYRPAQRVAYQRKGILGIIQQAGLLTSKTLAGTGARAWLETITKPRDSSWKDARGGSHLEVYFLSTLDRAADFSSVVDAVCESEKYDRSQVGIYIQPQLGGRVMHFEAVISFEEGGRAAAEGYSLALAESFAKGGAYFSRPSGNWADIPYRDKPLLTGTLGKAKRIFDPSGVLNPDVLCYREVV